MSDTDIQQVDNMLCGNYVSCPAMETAGQNRLEASPQNVLTAEAGKEIAEKRW